MEDLDILSRFLEKIKESSYGCWEWQAYINPKGYGKFGVKGKVLRAHRWSYSYFKGTIPEKMMIDHVCRNRKCVNPSHLRVVTPLQNVTENIVRIGYSQSKQNNKGPVENVEINTGANGERIK